MHLMYTRFYMYDSIRRGLWYTTCVALVGTLWSFWYTILEHWMEQKWIDLTCLSDEEYSAVSLYRGITV